MKHHTDSQSTGSQEASISERRAEQAPAARQTDAAARLDTSMIASMMDLRGKKDSSLFDQLYRGFVERARAAQSSIAAAAARGDWASALTSIHKHRSDSGFLGLALYSRHCGELEALAREACEGAPPAARVWCAALDVVALELQPGLDALDAHVGTVGAESDRSGPGVASRPTHR